MEAYCSIHVGIKSPRFYYISLTHKSYRVSYPPFQFYEDYRMFRKVVLHGLYLLLTLHVSQRITFIKILTDPDRLTYNSVAIKMTLRAQ